VKFSKTRTERTRFLPQHTQSGKIIKNDNHDWGKKNTKKENIDNPNTKKFVCLALCCFGKKEKNCRNLKKNHKNTRVVHF